LKIERLYILILLVVHQLLMHAQPISIKLKASPNEFEYPMLIQASPDAFSTYLEQHKDIQIGSQSGNIFTIYTTLSEIKNLYRQPWVERIEDGKFQLLPMADSSRIHNNVDSIHQGQSPLTTNYKGRNVMVGFIDYSIEWRHLDFKNSVNDTRIMAIWDQNKDSLPPSGFTYGHLYKKTDIDSGNCKQVASTLFGHGTNVAGIAVGNGNIKVEYRGNAPEAKIAFVALKNNNSWLTNLADGVRFLDKLADSLNLPLVINISVGGYDGSHDGRDLATRMIESILSKKGRSIIAAGGNAGHMDQHIQMVPNGDTLFTSFKHNNAFAGTYFNFWADTADTRHLTIGIQADSSFNFIPRSKPYFFPFGTRFLDSLQILGYYEDTISIYDTGNQKIGLANFYVLKQENTINFQCFIQPTNAAHLWRFSSAGVGRIDMWVNPSLQTTSAVQISPLPSIIDLPEIVKYTLPDQNMSIVSSFQCSEKIVTVGNVVNKYGIIDIDTIYRAIGGRPREIASNSSKGPTRDLRLKPDITAAGGQTMTTIDSITAANFKIQPSNRRKLGITGHYSVAGGTSMASPAVAGIVACLMEKSPHLKSNEIKYLIQKTSFKDSFTSQSANNTYGHGKINGFQLMAYHPTYGCRDTGSINYNSNSDFEDSSLCVKKRYGCTDTGSINYNPTANTNDGSCIPKVYGCTDTGSVNYNSNANIDNGSCIPKVYGCTDSLAENYNPSANTDNGSCTYRSQINNIQLSNQWTICSISSNQFRVESQKTGNNQLMIYDLYGRTVNILRFSTSLDLDLQQLSTGIYIFRLSNYEDTDFFKIQIQ
jgi:subtilisin family serine protease